MNSSLRLGRVGGVPLGAHWSVLVIFGFIAWGLSTQRFPDAYPGHAPWVYAVAGLGTALAFFGGLLAHEVAHAVVARRHGLPVEGITLWVMGGVAHLGGEAATPRAELRVAGSGPLVSLLLGVGLGAVTAGVGLAAGTGLAFGCLLWLAGINVALVVFNVIPAAPLDGGRLLRAGLWRLRGDRTWASVVAARAGQAVGVTIAGAAGWACASGRAGLGMLWFVAVGWFLVVAAGRERRHALVTAALADVTVGDVMGPATPGDDHDGAAVTSPDEPVVELLPRLQDADEVRAVVVVDGECVGTVSPSDIEQACAGQERPAA